jgi:transcriptional regulator of acetoin/glycerol metabolism
MHLQPPYSYSEAQRAKALQQLRWVEASLCRGAALARLKALLMQQPGQLQHWQQAAAAAAAAAGGQHLAGLPGEQAYHEHWKQQQQEQQQQGAGEAAPSSRQGRPLFAAFHAHSMRSPWLMHSAPGTAASAAAGAARAATAADSSSRSSGSGAPTPAAASGGGWDVSNTAAEQQQLCRVISQLTVQTRELKQQLGSTDTALGVLPQVQK